MKTTIYKNPKKSSARKSLVEPQVGDDRTAMQDAADVGLAKPEPRPQADLDKAYDVEAIIARNPIDWTCYATVDWTTLPRRFWEFAQGIDSPEGRYLQVKRNPDWRPKVNETFVLSEVGLLFTYLGNDKFAVAFQTWRREMTR